MGDPGTKGPDGDPGDILFHFIKFVKPILEIQLVKFEG